MLTISERHADEARRVVNRLRSEGFRIELDDSDATIGRRSECIVDSDQHTWRSSGMRRSNMEPSPRDRAGQQVTMSHQAVIDGLRSEIDSRAMGSSLIPSAE